VTAEATLREQILKRIHEDYPRRTSGVLVFGRPASAATGPGHPDLFGVALGRFLALEVKVLKAQPTPLQVQRIKDLRSAGAYAWVIRSPLDATRAVYQAKIGGRVPDTTDPIDFDDWFKEITSTPVSVPTASVADKAEPSTEADSDALDDLLNLGEEAAAQPEPVAADKPKRARRRAATTPVVEPEPLEELPSFDDAVTRPTVDDLQDARDAGLLGLQQPDPGIQALANQDQNLAYIVELIKAVGDRVTLVYEEINKVESVLLSMSEALTTLRTDFDALIEDEG